MNRFRRLMAVVLISGTVAGLSLFALQHYTTFPLIEKAEVYESAAEKNKPVMPHDDEGWQPSEGLERTFFTAATTTLTGIAFAGLLFGIVALRPIRLDWRKGALWGIAAFACVNLAPALGLPPQPPGVPSADLYTRQLWWIGTAVATAIGLWLMLDRQKRLWIRASGLVLMAFPHIVGAPVTNEVASVPTQLIHQFATFSIVTTGVFWIILGAVGGLLYKRWEYAENE